MVRILTIETKDSTGTMKIVSNHIRTYTVMDYAYRLGIIVICLKGGPITSIRTENLITELTENNVKVLDHRFIN